MKIAGWEEETVAEMDAGAKMTRVHAKKSYEGDLEADATVEFLMYVRADGSADFVGYEVVTGSLNDLAGSFVFSHVGTFEAGKVDSTLTVVEGSATGALSGLRGKTDFVFGHQEEYPINFEYGL
jgi:hypothetical protein